MLPISRILIPVDYSERCLAMIPYAKEFAQHYNAEILLLHVVNPVYFVPETGISASAILAVPEWILSTQTKKMEEFAVSELRDSKSDAWYTKVIQKRRLLRLQRQRPCSL
jgi:hypothetical protein